MGGRVRSGSGTTRWRGRRGTPDAHRVWRVGGGGALALTVAAGVLAMPATNAFAVSVQQATVVSAVPADNTPDVLDGQVDTILQVGSTMIIGGTFTQVQNPKGGTIYTRDNIAAFDVTTGDVITTFVPTVDGEVMVLLPGPDASTFVAGGSFKNVDGTAWAGLARLKVADGSRDTTFAAHLVFGRVFDAVSRGGHLYVGGQFSKVTGGSRTNLASFNSTTGALDPLNLPVTGPREAGTTANVHVLDVTADGTKMIISGNFTTVGGVARSQIAMVALTTGTVSTWQTDSFAPLCNLKMVTYIRGIDFSGDGTYFVVVDSGAAHKNTLCDSASRFEATGGAGQLPTWVNYTGGDTLTQVAVTGAAVYIGGHMRWMSNPLGHNSAGPGAIPREGLAALNPADGSVLSWNPGRTRGAGVFALYATTTGLWEGCDTDEVGGKIRKRIAFFPLT
jgi:hypothetical protein